MAKARQFELLEKPKRKAPRVLMHVTDAGTDAIHFACARCGHRDWYRWDRSKMPVSEAKRGIPCPKCN